tara:strand:- start:697 stop:903 length:207 start_codon:yes stop_codon:yes gene_type:complete
MSEEKNIKKYVVKSINQGGQIRHSIHENEVPANPYDPKYKKICEKLMGAHAFSIKEGGLEEISTSFKL